MLGPASKSWTSFARRWLPAIAASLGVTIVVLWLRRWIDDDSPHEIIRAALLIAIAVVALPWLRDLIHALVFVLEGRFRLGDDLRIGAVEGRLASIGVRAIVLRSGDGTEIVIPHAELARGPVERLNLEARDAPCEIALRIPTAVDVRRAAELARISTALSPYAAPRLEPQVFSIDDPHGAMHLRVRGYVFDRDHEALFRTDVAVRFSRMMRDEDTGERLLLP